MNTEKLYEYGALGTVAKEWAQVAFWIAGALVMLTASYRFLFA